MDTPAPSPDQDNLGNRDAMNADVADSQTPAAAKTADEEASPPLSAVEHALYEGRFDTRDSMLLEVGLPIALLVVGVVLHIAVARTLVWPSATWPVAAWIAVTFVLQVVFMLPLTVVSVLMTARWFDYSVGRLGFAMLKISAITFGSASLGDALIAAGILNYSFSWEVVVFGFAACLITAGVPAAALFRVGLHETAIFTLLMFAPRMILAFGIAACFPQKIP